MPERVFGSAATCKAAQSPLRIGYTPMDASVPQCANRRKAWGQSLTTATSFRLATAPCRQRLHSCKNGVQPMQYIINYDDVGIEFRGT